MNRALALIVALLAPAALAQTDAPADPLDRSVVENLRAARTERAPGNVIKQALARHNQIVEDRLDEARFGSGDGEDDDDGTDTGGAPATPGGSSGGLSGIGDLIDSLGGIGGISGLLGGLGGGGLTTGGGAAGTGSFGNLPPEALALIQAAGIDISSLGGIGSTGSRSKDRTPLTAQAVTDDEEVRPFRLRLADSLLSTFFTAATLAISSPTFVDLLADGIRDLMSAGSADADDDGNDDNGGNGGSNDDDSDDGDEPDSII